jgi:hypothetical protein
MGSQLNYFSENFNASTDLSAVPQRFVTITTAGVVRLAQSGEYAEGVLENIPAAAMPATVSFTGITKVEVDDAYPIGTYIVPGTDGIGTVYTAPTATYIRGKLLEASGASGDIVMMRLIDDVVATGMIGPTGATGVKGSTGIQGGTGVAGQTGLQGQTGIIGLQGDTGIQGGTGIQGLQGDTGIQGGTGIQGTQGDTGIQGGTGIQGTQGDTGLQGQTGIIGLTGGTGIQGQTGIAGLTIGATGAGATPAGTIAANIGGVDVFLLYSAGA